MPLSPGQRLGPYEILSSLGAGGMGEVYEAKDTRLGRTVAIKVLPEGLARNPERLTRFEREARMVSQLSHPHVCTLHDVGEEDGIHFLVMERLEGETLAERLERGALPLEETLRHGAEIAEALDAAHRRGVIHRDLKPANVMLTSSGVKLLDFGLARMAAGEDEEVADLPTMTMDDAGALTDEGTVLGTFPYMSPEQVEGAEADARSDLFALGAVLYEMVTGRRAFQGESAASVMAAVLREEPEPITKIEPVSPPALDHVVSRCLTKDADRRWQSARDVAEELRWIREAGSRAGVAAPVAKRRESRERLAWGAAALLALLIALTLGWLGLSSSEDERAETSPFLFTIPPPEGTSHSSFPAISPDGRRVAFPAFPEDEPPRLWVRPFDSLRAQPLAGTEEGQMPFWSPDGRSLGFFSGDELERIDLASGSVRSLARIENPLGATWSTSGVVVFADDQLGLVQVPETGGPPTPVELFGDDLRRIYAWPHMLPGGRRLLVTSWVLQEGGGLGEGGLYLGTLDGGEPRLLRAASGPEEMGRPQYDPAGYLLFHSRQGGGSALLAQNLDIEAGELTGDPFQVAEVVFATGPGVARFSVGPGGLLVLREAASHVQRQLYWLGRADEASESLGPAGPWGPLALSPNGSTVAVPDDLEDEILLVDARRGTPQRIADAWGAHRPIWSPEGQRLALAIGGPPNPFVLEVAEGGEPRRVAAIPSVAIPTGWTPDGEHLVVDSWGNPAGLFLVSLESGELQPLLTGDDSIGDGRVSPGGRWLAYTSSETGQSEVYVTSFPRPGRRWRVSGAGGDEPRWSSDGSSLLFQRDDQVVEVPVESSGDDFRFGDPQVVVQREGLLDWDVGPDGRFLIALPGGGDPIRPPLVVISDWRGAVGVETLR